jgi:Skp family chaperone for outer membrane proteins
MPYENEHATRKEAKNELDTYDINDIEIFQTGKWNGDTYTDEDFKQTVQYNKEHKEIKPFFKLGHSNELHGNFYYSDKVPAIGWIKNLRKAGDKLIADIKHIPKYVYELLKTRGYSRLSPEFMWGRDKNGKIRKILSAVAVLGAKMPACDTVEDFFSKVYESNVDEDLLITNSNNEVRSYENIKEDEMSENKNEDIAKEYEDKLNKMKDELTKKYEKELNDAQLVYEDKIKQYEVAKVQTEVNAFLNKKVSEGKLLPSQKGLFSFLAMKDMSGRKVYESVDNGQLVKKDYSSNFEVVKDLIELGQALDFTESTQNIEKKKYEGLSEEEKADSELDGKVKEYQKKHNVSYIEALQKIQEG